MAAIALTQPSLVAVKKSLTDEFDEVKSSHLSEALAASLGFRTHASLLAALPPGPPNDAPFVLLDSERLVNRLQELGYPPDLEFDFETLMRPVPEVMSTMHLSSYDIDYAGERKKAWRNLMVCAINAALEQRLFTLRAGDNRFGDGQLFDFILPGGLPARGWVGDAGFDELSVHAAVHPKGDWVRAANARFEAGEAWGQTWLERRTGFWMQSSSKLFACRHSLIPALAGLQVAPKGYGDRGRVIM